MIYGNTRFIGVLHERTERRPATFRGGEDIFTVILQGGGIGTEAFGQMQGGTFHGNKYLPQQGGEIHFSFEVFSAPPMGDAFRMGDSPRFASAVGGKFDAEIGRACLWPLFMKGSRFTVPLHWRWPPP